MTVRYVTRPKGYTYWDEDERGFADVSSRTILLDDDEPVKTGLLDASGTPLYRVRERIRFGFVVK